MWVLHLGLSHRLKGIQTTYMGYFEMTLHVRIAFKVDLHLNLKYLHLYLFLPTRTLGPNYNTRIHIYLYQLKFLGLLVIPVFNINIITILIFCISNFFAHYFGNNNNLCGILDLMCVECMMFNEFGLWFPPYKIDPKINFLALMATIFINN